MVSRVHPHAVLASFWTHSWVHIPKVMTDTTILRVNGTERFFAAIIQLRRTTAANAKGPVLPSALIT